MVTEYDELAPLTLRTAKHTPQELLPVKDWRKLIKPYAPGAPARDMEGKDWYADAPARRLRADIREHLQAAAQKARSK